MKLLLTLLAIVSCFALIHSKDRNDKPSKVVCYFASWTADYDGENKFTPEGLNPNVCTHVNFAFAELVNNKIQLSNSDLSLLKRVVALRQKNTHLTVLVSIGGWGEGSTKYSQMVRTKANRQTFILSVVDFLKANDLDGLDVDWEYPAFSGVDSGDRTLGRAEDKQDFVTLLQELKTAFSPLGYILTGALTSAKYNIDHAYNISGISKYMDYINLMTYDYHGTWSTEIGYNSPLYPDPKWSSDDQQMTVQFTVDYFLQNGADPKKLVVGIPLYGYVFQLASSSNHQIGAKATKGSDAGRYGQICQQVKQSGWTVTYDAVAQVSYALKGNQWLTYDNLQSVSKKLNYVVQNKLGGAMVWEVDGDDFAGKCGDGKFPMTKLMMKTLNNVAVN